MLHFASVSGSIAAAKVLIKAGVKVYAKNKDGITPIQVAMVREDCDMFTLLVSAFNY